MKLYSLLCIILLMGAIFHSDATGRPKCIVKFDNGIGAGVLQETFTKKLYCSYRGIPYVQPPVGELRFEDPVPLYFDASVTFDNTSHPCIQQTVSSRKFGHEDCLYLNVYTTYVRMRKRPRPLMPVLVWIHGGSFTEGSSETDIFGNEFILDEDVLVVTFNYRLSSLGFLAIDDLNIASNLGLKDQTEAFRWVNRNIRSFGGDPDRVTIMGWSSGSAAATYHMYAQSSRKLFQHVIAMSGTMTQPWAYNFIRQWCSNEFLKQIDVTTKGELKTKPAGLLVSSDGPKFHYFTFNHLCYMPSSDNDYAPKNPYDMVRMMKPVSDVPLLIGSTAVEHDNLFDLKNFSMDQFNYPNSNVTIYERIRDYLEQCRANRSARVFYRKLGSFADYHFGLQYFIEKASQQFKSSIYSYRFAFDGPFAYAKNIYYRNEIHPMTGAMHGDDLGYFFTPYNYRSIVTSSVISEPLVKQSLKVLRRMVRLWTNFIKYGNPTPPNSKTNQKKWPPYNDRSQPRQVLHINRQLKVQQENISNNYYYKLWKTVFNCMYYFECDFLNEIYDE
ncbi:venom carboxylesterase-6-like [Armigeres subalbatus]|uniref:venom carboxylesterase-6-like n=1 Tax=Armigeres subalbatus TaxID=124917 RepID=UPI002ED32A51